MLDICHKMLGNYSKDSLFSASDFCWTDTFEKCQLFWLHGSSQEIVTGCVESDAKPGRFWCPTQLTNKAFHPDEIFLTGVCSEKCPVHSEERLEFLKHSAITQVPIRFRDFFSQIYRRCQLGHLVIVDLPHFQSIRSSLPSILSIQ